MIELNVLMFGRVIGYYGWWINVFEVFSVVFLNY